MPKLAIIADDLTGANDTGVQFRKFGMKTLVLLEAKPAEWIRQAEVAVLDTDSRAINALTAADRVRAGCLMFASQGMGDLYKKVDSTLRGNVGAEIAAAAEEFQPVVTIIAPAFPKTGRNTVGGYQLLQGVPISCTEIARDPKTPVHEAYIPKLLASYGGERLGLVPLHVIDAGTAEIAAAMQELIAAGKTWIVCDATSEEHLLHIAEAAIPFQKVLWVGSAGLAEQLAHAKGWVKSQTEEKEKFHCANVLVAAGSVSETTRQQVLQYVETADAVNLVLDPLAAIHSPQSEGRRLSGLAAPLIKERNIVLSCSNERSVIETAVASGRKVGLNAGDVALRIASAMGSAVNELVAQGIDGLFMTGGEIAISCCRTMGATGLEISQEVVPGIPLGRLMGGVAQGLPVVTKAGAFGDKHAIAFVVNTLKGHA